MNAEKLLKSTGFTRNGDKSNSDFFETYQERLLEERDRCGLTDLIDEIEALMITVEPGNSIEYISELALRPHSRYLGEILRVSDRNKVLKLQQARELFFFTPDALATLDLPSNVSISKPPPLYPEGDRLHGTHPECDGMESLQKAGFQHHQSTFEKPRHL